MKKTGSFNLSAAATKILHAIIYLIFLVYSIYLIAGADNTGTRITYIVITVVMLSVVLFYEYLQYHYEQAIAALNYECDPEKSKALFDSMQKKDIVHAYRNQRVIYDVLYNLSKYQPDEVIRIIESNDKIFRGEIDQLLIRNASLFLAHIEANNKTAAKKAYPEVLKLKGTKIKGKKLSALYSWEELEALNYYISNDFKKAIKSYEAVKTNYMNNRQLTQYYYYYALSLAGAGRNDEARKTMTKVIKISNKLPVAIKAQEFLS